MKTSNRIWRKIAGAGLTLSLASGLGLSIPAAAAGSGSWDKSANPTAQHQALRAAHEKMLAEAKAEDAALQKMITDLNKAPESQKPDLEAAILAKLVTQHHEMLGEWESLHSQMVKLHREHNQISKNESTATHTPHGANGQYAATAPK